MQHILPSDKECEENGCIFVELSPVYHLYYSHWKTKYDASLFLRLPDSPHRMICYETCWHSPQGMEDWQLLTQLQLLTWSLTRLSAPLVALIIAHERALGICQGEQMLVRIETKKMKRRREEEAAKEISKRLLENMKRCLILAQEKGASSWLTVEPL